jgi:hypothetical protein
MLTTEFKGKELRSSKRYNYYGKVELRRPQSGAAVSGHIFNISTGGWLMKANVPADESHLRYKSDTQNSLSHRMLSEFGKDTQVEARFESSYLSFLAWASIRRCDEEQGLIGLSFLDMPERGRNDLCTLVTDLEYMSA